MALSELPSTYATPSEIIIQAAQDEVIALLDQFLALLPDYANKDGAASSPDFDCIRPELEVIIRAEIEAIKTAVDAAPVA